MNTERPPGSSAAQTLPTIFPPEHSIRRNARSPKAHSIMMSCLGANSKQFLCRRHTNLPLLAALLSPCQPLINPPSHAPSSLPAAPRLHRFPFLRRLDLGCLGPDASPLSRMPALLRHLAPPPPEVLRRPCGITHVHTHPGLSRKQRGWGRVDGGGGSSSGGSGGGSVLPVGLPSPTGTLVVPWTDGLRHLQHLTLSKQCLVPIG